MSFCVSFFSVAPFAPLLKYTCYMCNRQGAHKSDRISSSLCSHDNALLYLYWYLHFMLIWPWCILSYVWWEAIKLFWILNLENKQFDNRYGFSISIGNTSFKCWVNFQFSIKYCSSRISNNRNVAQQCCGGLWQGQNFIVIEFLP